MKQRKTIRLQNTYRQHESDVHTCKVVFEMDSHLIVIFPWAIAKQETTLTKNADGTWTNENRVNYAEVKADRRPKPYSVKYEGWSDGTKTTKFATLAEVQTYVRERWMGVDYIDGPDGWHGDYGRFTLSGCALFDLMLRHEYEVEWRAL